MQKSQSNEIFKNKKHTLNCCIAYWANSWWNPHISLVNRESSTSLASSEHIHWGLWNIVTLTEEWKPWLWWSRLWESRSPGPIRYTKKLLSGLALNGKREKKLLYLDFGKRVLNVQFKTKIIGQLNNQTVPGDSKKKSMNLLNILWSFDSPTIQLENFTFTITSIEVHIYKFAIEA